MVRALVWVLFLAIILGTSLAASDREAPESSPDDAVSITANQYCFGCKETVSLYTALTLKEMAQMQRSGKKSSSELEANRLVNNLCDSPLINHKFQPFVKFSCIKLLNDHQPEFLQAFAGRISVSAFDNKADLFRRKRKICAKTAKACKPHEFKKANVTQNARTRCAACEIVANEIYTLSQSVLKNVSMPKLLEEEFCSSLGGSYQPYAWVENVCDELVEDHAQDILDAINFHKRVAATGFAPSESVAEMICKERLKCPKKTGTPEL